MNYNKADFISSYGISSQLPESDRPELSFSGRSNVGKSSLINKLCNRKNLARVSATPGKKAKKPADAAAIPQTTEQPKPGAVC